MMRVRTEHRVRAVDDAMLDRSSAWLVRACGADGKFEYRVNLDPTVVVKPRYNVLRHAGAMYALVMDHDRRPDPEVRAAIERAGAFLVRECVGPVDEEPGLLAVWSRPELNGSDRPVTAKLGGAGLGLVALTGLERLVPGSVPDSTLRSLARFIVWMQKDDGSFYSKHVPSRGGRRDRWTSLYYPGEAALGLVMLHERDRDPLWRIAAARTLGYLAETRRGQAEIPADHWALLATARLLPVLPRGESPGAAALIAHAVQVCESMLVDQVWAESDRAVRGGFTADGRLTPTATRLEGLLAAMSFLPKLEEQDVRERVAASVHSAMKVLAASQVREGVHAGAIPRALRALPKGDPRWSRRFNRRAGEVRIDYVQHALSAMIQYVGALGEA